MGERERPVRHYWARLAGGDGGAAEGCCVIGVIEKKDGHCVAFERLGI